MNFFKTLDDFRLYIISIWSPTIKTLRSDLDSVTDRVEIVEEDVEVIEEDVAENTEDILATKSEVKEVRDLLALLVFELTDMGFDFKDERLVKLIEEYDKIEI